MLRIKFEKVNLKYEGWLISNLGDLFDYKEMTDSTFVNGIKSLIKTDVPVDRWDHLTYKNEFGNLLKHSLIKCETHGGSPLLTIGEVYDEKLRNMGNHILNGNRLLVNDLGGYCFVDCEYEKVDYYKKKIHSVINENTTWINFENDPVLKAYTNEFLGNIDKNFSYVTETYSISKDELIDVLIEFKNKGGQGIWQYTTGINIDQLYMFIDSGIEVGLKNFVVNFNSGNNNSIQKLIDYYSDPANAIDFKYNFVNR